MGRRRVRRTRRTASATTSCTARDTVNPAGTGTKGALWYRLDVAAGETAEIRLRFAPEREPLDDTWAPTMADREREADEFYAALAGGLDADEAMIMRQAFAGMMWGKQFFHYDVERWLDGDPASRRRRSSATGAATTCGRTSTTTT